MRLQELLPSYQLHQTMVKHPWTTTAVTHVPAAPRLLTLLPSPPVWEASPSRVGSGAVSPSWGSLPTRCPSLNLFCSGASSSLLCRPSLPPRSLPASSGLPGGLAMASGGGFWCLLSETRKEAGASRCKRPRGGSGASALRLWVRAGQLCAALLVHHRPLLAIMGTACRPVRTRGPLERVPTGCPIEAKLCLQPTHNRCPRKESKGGLPERLGEAGQHSHSGGWLYLYLE